jgi:hypothetical protein
MFGLKNLALILLAIFLCCAGAHSEIYSAEVMDAPTKTNQLKTIALFPLISPTKEKTTLFENKAYFRKLQARCGNILVNQSEDEWATNSRKIPDRHDLLRFGKDLNSDGVLVSYPEDGVTVSVLLNTRGNTVWVNKHKPTQWLNLCKEIKKGNSFEELPLDRGGKVAVLRVVDASGNERVSEIWRAAIEDKFKKRGYKIVDSNQVPAPKSFVAVATSTGIYAPSGIELRSAPKVIKRMEIDISSVAAALGVDWVVIGTSESTVSENIGVYNKISVSGTVEVYKKDGELSESYRIYRLIEHGGVHVVVVAHNLLDAVIGNSGKIYDAVYSGVNVNLLHPLETSLIT